MLFPTKYFPNLILKINLTKINLYEEPTMSLNHKSIIIEKILGDGFTVQAKSNLIENNKSKNEEAIIAPTPEHIKIIFKEAIPSPIDNQAWLFFYANDVIYVAYDKTKNQIPDICIDDLTLIDDILENIKISASSLGFGTKINYHQLSMTNDIFVSVAIHELNPPNKNEKLFLPLQTNLHRAAFHL